ncbi:hypothetical protein [Flavonifractor plautii]|jgi:hypothetical protein|uniref:hypothetical protein n=1 Tax=Flavonifractor plautii TaxID=292800 RepID=UPI00189AAC1D|nr:hypothetical protein [Flavonifractor plautii]MCB7042455.1 hypothetical protein [Flavonifractor plautii]MCG4705169.1 hypothetical protein [Flavonifractor plautii]MDB7866401.1 hypothetical protein [Flavonifractor plautii]MDB7870435.1 hypothetical protein [Flavonifractor plautii]MDB7885904.1 hypothetical protein [Flavonifractor plautii]
MMDEFIRKKYCIDTLEDIKRHWIALSQGDVSISCQDSKHAWFGDLSWGWEDIKKRIKKKVFQYFPINVRDCERRKEICTELSFLLPKTLMTQMFLPVLLNSYFTNYRHIQQVSEKKDRHGLCSTIQNGTCSELKIMKYLNVWIMAPMLESYPKINADHCREANISRVLPIYLRAIQFLIFLIITSRICNVPLSLLAFEYMTGYLHLVDSQGYFKKLESLDVEDIQNSNIKRDEEIMKNVDGILKDFFDITIHPGKRGDKKVGRYPFSFACFLALLQEELDGDENRSTQSHDPRELGSELDGIRLLLHTDNKSLLADNQLWSEISGALAVWETEQIERED